MNKPDWITEQQIDSLAVLAARHRANGVTLADLVADASPIVGGSGAISVGVGKQVVIIETDGHRHT